MKTIRSLFTLFFGALLCFGVIVGIRFVEYTPPAMVHYHANYAVFIQKNLLDLSLPKYMEPVEICNVDPMLQTPQARVHQHNGKVGEVHVHASTVTWGDFFTNLGFSLTPTSLTTDDGTVYPNADGKVLRYILNDKIVSNPANSVIGDRDRLLIDFDSESVSDAMDRFTRVPATALSLDQGTDPASCGGSDMLMTTPKERMKKALNITL
jgi:hypothetical protein